MRAHALAQHLAGGSHVAEAVGVAAPQLERIEAQGGRDPVHVAFDGELGLRRAEAAEGAVRRRVGGDRAGANRDVGTAVGTGGVDSPAREHHR